MGDRLQGRVVDRDQFRRVTRLIRGLGDDEGDVIADQFDLPADQRRAVRLIDRRAAGARFVQILAGQAAVVLGIPVRAGEHPQHPRRVFPPPTYRWTGYRPSRAATAERIPRPDRAD